MFDICKIRGGNWLAEIAPDIGANILRLQHTNGWITENTAGREMNRKRSVLLSSK